jgi:hypothetical protein
MVGVDPEWLKAASDHCPVPGRLVSVVLFGSRAVRPELVRADSDADLFCLVDADLKWPQAVAQRCSDFLLDIYYTSGPLARANLARPDRNNAHYVLNALVEGTILHDPFNRAAELINLAWSIRKEGPPPMPPEQLQDLRVRSAAALQRIESLMAHGQLTAVDEGVLSLRCNTQFHILFYGYCRTRRMWASSIAGTFEWSRENAPELFGLASGFFSARTLSERRLALDGLYRAVC